MGGGQDNTQECDFHDSWEYQIGRINELERVLSGRFSEEIARDLLEAINDYFERRPGEKERTLRLPKCQEYLSGYFEKWYDSKELMKKLRPFLLK